MRRCGIPRIPAGVWSLLSVGLPGEGEEEGEGGEGEVEVEGDGGGAGDGGGGRGYITNRMNEKLYGLGVRRRLC